MSNSRNCKIRNFLTLINSINTSGDKEYLYGEPRVPNMVESHIQGLAKHTSFTVVSHNNKGYSKGFYMILDGSEDYLKFDSYDEHYNHPGGIQVIGDYLICAVENSSNDQSHIRLYDLSGASVKQAPKIISTFDIQSDQHGAGAVGIANYSEGKDEYYLVAATDKEKCRIYRSKPNQEIQSASFSELFQYDLPYQFQNIALVCDTQNTVYLIGFRDKYKITTYEDSLEIYSIDIQAKKLANVKSIHMHTNHGDIIGLAGVHFRWGAGIKIKSENEFKLYATQRNFVSGVVCTNVFSKK